MSSSSKSFRDYSRKHQQAILEPWRQSHNLPSSSPPQNLGGKVITFHPLHPHLSNLLDINLQQAIEATNLSPHTSPCIPPPSLDQEHLKADNTVRVNQIVAIFLIESSIHLLDQNRYTVDISLIHIESRKSPTAELFDVDSRRISIVIVNTKEYLVCNGYSLNDKNEAKTNKTDHENG
ncbi:hypothetical protein Tco_1332901 [Tanacetum coccineum]